MSETSASDSVVQELTDYLPGPFHGVERFEVGIKPLPSPDRLAVTLPAGHVVLVTHDGSSLTAEVVRRLEAEGLKVVVLNFASISTSTSEPYLPYPSGVSCASNGDAAIGEALQTIRQQHGEIGAFLHLHPRFDITNGHFSQHIEQERKLLKSVFFLAKHLKDMLTTLGDMHQAHFMTVTRLDGHLGLGGQTRLSVAGGGLNGLVKCLSHEWPEVACRALDLQPDVHAAEMAEWIVAEFQDPDRSLIETGRHKEGRMTLSATKVELEEGRILHNSITSESVFLVSGGARGVTADCVLAMARAFRCRFILIGRSDDQFEIPEYARGEEDDRALKRLIMLDLQNAGGRPSLEEVQAVFRRIVAKREVSATLEGIRAHGGEAIYVRGDITQVDGIRSSVAEAASRLGRISGVIHGAGRLADRFIQDKTEADFHHVVSVKLDGLLSLLDCVELEQLDHLILFSSVAGFYGNAGQTDYSMANEILSKTAHWLKAKYPALHVTSINWGGWKGGMVNKALERRFEQMGVTLLDRKGGPSMLLHELDRRYHDQAQVVIGGTLPNERTLVTGPLQTHTIHRNIRVEENPFLEDHVIQERPVLPMTSAMGWMASACERLYPGFRVHQLEEIKALKGIVLEPNASAECSLDLREIQKDDERIIIDVVVKRQRPSVALPLFHFRCRVVLLSESQSVEAPVLEHPKGGWGRTEQGRIFYRDGSLFHGGRFQGIDTVLDFTEEQMIVAVNCPEVTPADQGQFRVGRMNPFVADIQYQCMLLWVQKFRGGMNSLPVSTESATLYRALPFDRDFLLQMKMVQHSEHKLVADHTIYDEEGRVYLVTRNACVTMAKELVW